MPKLSIFTPIGHLKLSSEPSYGEQLFELGRSSLRGTGKGFSVPRDGRTWAWLYAWAMTLASARILIERAGQQWDPLRTYEYLPIQEAERGSIPQAGWSIQQRRAQLVWMRELILSVSRTTVENKLREIAGDGVLAVIPTAKADITNWPESLGDSPMILARSDLPRALAKLSGTIASAGTVTVEYERLAANIDFELQKGDVVVVEPDNDDRAERVEILSTTNGDGTGPYTATFVATNPHNKGTVLAKQPFPMWAGTKRHTLVVLTDEAAHDPQTRRFVQVVLERMSRGPSTWSIGGANDDNETAGPFLLGISEIGVTPIGAINL